MINALLIDHPFDRLNLILHLEVILQPHRLQPPFIHAFPHRAKGLVPVLAIAETTFMCQRLDVVEGVGYTFVAAP